MPIWLKRAPASILIFFSLVPEVTGTLSDWERTAVPQAKSRNWSGDGGWQADCIYCEQQNQSHHHPERFRQTPGRRQAGRPHRYLHSGGVCAQLQLSSIRRIWMTSTMFVVEISL